MRKGFTLIELMVALAIMVIVAGTSIIALSVGIQDAKLRSSCRMTASAINYARSHAVASGNKTRVVFDEGRTIEVEEQSTTTDSATPSSADDQFAVMTTSAGKPQTLADGVGMTRLVKKSGAQDEDWIEFDKSGQSQAAVVELSDSNNKKRYIVVDPITGRCRIETDVEEIVNGW